MSIRYYKLNGGGAKPAPAVPAVTPAAAAPAPRSGSQSFTACKPGGTPSTPAAAPVTPPPVDTLYPDTRRQAIGAAEIKELAIASVQAWKALPDEWKPGQSRKAAQDDWRHRQVAYATEGRAHGLREVSRADFRTVRAHFLNIAGLEERAFAMLLRTGTTAAGDAVETVEQCDKWIMGILARVKKHFATQGGNAEQRVQAWLQSIVEHKERKMACRWTSWPVKQRTDLYFTLKNRFAAMEGRGTTKGRNKSQRAKARAARRTVEDESEPF